MGTDRANELMSIPWRDLAVQFADEINTAANCMAWSHDTGKRRVLGGAYRLEMSLDAAEFVSSIASAPGFLKISPSTISAAAPVMGTWSGTIISHFSSHLRVWVGGTKLVDASPLIVQALSVDNFKLRGDLTLNTSAPDRPRLADAKLAAKLRMQLAGLFHASTGNVSAAVEYQPPNTYKLRIPFNVPIGDAGIPGVTIGAGFDGSFVLGICPHIGIGYEGDLSLVLFKAKVAGKTIKIEDRIPFKFYVDTKLPCPGFISRLLPAAPGIPIDWGEAPPEALYQTVDPLPDDKLLAAALEIEEAVLPQAAIDGAGVNYPIHAPDGLVYEIRTCCDQPGHQLYETIDDCAIWTGHFLAAESFRFAVTESPEALSRVNAILKGIEKLYQVTAVKGLLGRAAIRASSSYKTHPSLDSHSETGGSKCHPGEPESYYQTPIDGELWWGYGRGSFPTSRDAYLGVMLGLGYAHALVPDSAVQTKVRELVKMTLQNLLKNNWNVRTYGTATSPGPQKIITTFFNAIDLQLAILRLSATVNNDGTYQHFSGAADCAWVPLWGSTLDPVTQYFKFVLSHGVMSLLLFLETDGPLRQQYTRAFKMLRRTVCHHRNAYFNLVRIITEPAATRQAAIDEPSGFAPGLSVGEETRVLLTEWLIRRRCIPGPRGLPTERPADPEYLIGLLKPHATNRAVKYTPLGATKPIDDLIAEYALPVHKRPGDEVDFIWQRPPFTTDMCVCGKTPRVHAGRPEVESPGIDYLLPFWMAAYLKVVHI